MAQKSPSSSSNAMAIATGAAGNVIADIVKEGAFAPILKYLDAIIHMEPNNQSMLHNRERLKYLSQDISAVFRDSENTARSEILQYYAGKMINLIKKAESLNIALSQPCISDIGIPRQLPELAAEMEKLLNDMSSDSATAANFRLVMMPLETPALPQSSASGQPEERVVLLQPIPDGGFVGKAIETAETKLKMWISVEPLQVKSIGVYGMPGAGKTSLLQSVYNFYNVSNVFDKVIWLTVSRDYKIPDLQKRIGQQIGLDLSSTDDIDARKMQLFANLKNKKFLLILDDLWRALDLKELGVAFEADKGSKVVFSSRNKDFVLTEDEESMELELLTREDGWLLFERVAFKGSHAEGEIMECAKKIAEECQCLPLAITVVAKAMIPKKTLAEWEVSLSQMKKSYFPDIHGSVYKDLYQKLEWSYKELAQTPNSMLQLCFLYCAMYPEDEKIWVDELVRIWIGEGFIEDMQHGYSYVKLLIDRGLFQSVNPVKQGMGILVNKPVNVWKKRFITVHDVIRDVAINIGEQQKNYLCRAGLQLRAFPRNAQQCQRVSVRCNQIESVRKDILCTQLVSLILSTNLNLNSLSFLNNLNSLRILDLSNTQIESVPTSLPELRVLDLSNTKIESVPTSFTRLQFLTLRGTCIKELPREIGDLSDLEFLDVSECKYLTSLPEEISQLRSLRRLHLSMGMENAVTDPKNVMALRGLKNLTELHLYLFFKFEEHRIMGTIMESWVEMRHLYLHYNHMLPSKSNLPEGMQRMKNLQTLVLYDYRGTGLPDWICEFEQLKRLELDSCGNKNVEKLPFLGGLPCLKFLKVRKYSHVRDLEIRSRGFPKLEMLHLSEIPKLKSIGERVLEEAALPNLRVLKIKKCPLLRKLPIGLEKLPNFKALYGHKMSWWEKLGWEDKTRLHELFREI